MQALAGLQEVRRAALGPLLAVLADPKRAAEYANVRTVLAGMGRPARDALVAILDGADPKLKVQAILTLAEMNDPKVAIDLLWPCVSEKSDAEVRAAAAGALKQLTGRVPTRAEAIALLQRCRENLFRPPATDRRRGRRPRGAMAVGCRTSGNAWSHSGTPEDAARALAARFAREAYCPGARRPRDSPGCILAAMLDAAAYRSGLDRPLDEKDPAVAEAKQFGVKRDRRTCWLMRWRSVIRRQRPRRPDCWAKSARPTNCCIKATSAARRWSGRCKIPTAGCGWPPWRRSCD